MVMTSKGCEAIVIVVTSRDEELSSCSCLTEEE
jgi:hypothetical protein